MAGARLLLVLLSALLWSGPAGALDSTKKSRCERIRIPMCENMPYNMTRMPNLMGHTDQEEAAIQVHEFVTLVEIGCSRHLKFFLCSLYAPMCTEQVDIPIPACRSMCEEVKAKCLPVLQRFSFPWPPSLNCTRLPEKNGLCMEFPDLPEEHSDTPDRVFDFDKAMDSPDIPFFLYNPSVNSKSALATTRASPQCASDRFVYVNKLKDKRDQLGACSPMCRLPTSKGEARVDVFFRRADKNFVEIWIAVWASFCFVATAFTVLTFWIDMGRFKYPERPIYFLAMCYNIYSVAFLIRLIAGADAISCDTTYTQDKEPVTFLIREGLESTGCIIVFLILYFFGMASSIWWVILTLTWFLAACRKWGHEAIEAMSSYFHLAAWGIPAVKTMVILIMRRVDADEFTAMCFTGNMDAGALLGFVIAPLATYNALGVVFILYGFFALVRIRKTMKRDGTNIDKLEKLMVKIGIFSVMYLVPATCVLGCFVYQYCQLDGWIARALAARCRHDDCSDELEASIPNIAVFMLKICMSLIVGISSGMWVWTSKTWHSWCDFCGRPWRRSGRRKKLTYHQQPAVVQMTTTYRGEKYLAPHQTWSRV
ncbi:PREDICTED: frizzled-9-like [Priapulus caudatus]|uniref:Frizzled-9-like n=1 Tax=Priapulus caudatus TaxID=37621 RepID=A0ABM1EPT3_PRICU|nr:PREDICTED: frizzled-9-like [Priapulus caudatus]